MSKPDQESDTIRTITQSELEYKTVAEKVTAISMIKHDSTITKQWRNAHTGPGVVDISQIPSLGKGFLERVENKTCDYTIGHFKTNIMDKQASLNDVSAKKEELRNSNTPTKDPKYQESHDAKKQLESQIKQLEESIKQQEKIKSKAEKMIKKQETRSPSANIISKTIQIKQKITGKTANKDDKEELLKPSITLK